MLRHASRICQRTGLSNLAPALSELADKWQAIRTAPSAARWHTIGKVAVMPTRYRTIVIDAANLPMVTAYKWHVRADDKSLYVRAWIDSRRASADRGKAIYLQDLLMRPGGGEVVDFINNNTLDCRRSNKRLADKSDDCCNRSVAHSNTGYLGVHYCAERKKYVAQIRYRGKGKNIGRFDNLMDAVAAREKTAADLHGEFASKLNQRLISEETEGHG